MEDKKLEESASTPSLPLTTHIETRNTSNNDSINTTKYEQPKNINNLFKGVEVVLIGDYSCPTEELKKKIENHGGKVSQDTTKKVDFLLVNQSYTSEISPLVEITLKEGGLVVKENFIHDSLRDGELKDIKQYTLKLPGQQIQSPIEQVIPQIQIPQSNEQQVESNIDNKTDELDVLKFEPATTTGISLETGNVQVGPPVECSTSQNVNTVVNTTNSDNIVNVWLKGSRQTCYNDDFPEILYTLTWKHKYDLKIVSKHNIFSGKEQNSLIDNISMYLVLADTNQIPVYDKAKTKRRRTNTTRRKQKKPSNTDTVTISSINKASDNEVVIRFGINSTFCSKRFGYSAFKLCITYAPQDTPEDYHFTILTPCFKTFVKKSANITKYLNYPKPLYPSRTTTITTSPKKEALSSSIETTPKKKSPRKSARKRKRNDDFDEYEEDSPKEKQKALAVTGQDIQTNIPPMLANPTANNWYGLLNTNKNLTSHGITWYGTPIGMNANGDTFYLAFCKDGVIYKLNDFVYLAPEGEQASESNVFWISKIINLVETKNEGMKLIGQWFYRWGDVQGFGGGVDTCSTRITKKQYILNKDKEVFVSFDINYNSLRAIRGKCYVKYMDKEDQRKEKEWLSKKNHFFFHSGFNRVKGELFELPEAVLKILKETTNPEDDSSIYPTTGTNGTQKQSSRQMVKPSDNTSNLYNIKVPDWRVKKENEPLGNSDESEMEMIDDSIYEKLHSPREQMEKEKRKDETDTLNTDIITETMNTESINTEMIETTENK